MGSEEMKDCNTVKNKAIIETIIKDSIAYFCMETYFVGIHWIRLCETNPMNSRKIGLDAEFTRIIMEINTSTRPMLCNKWQHQSYLSL